MPTIPWFRLAAICVFTAPIAAQGPQPKVRQVATFPGLSVADAVWMPNGRVILYGTYDRVTGYVYAYDVATKHSTLVTRGYDGTISITPAGDRIAYDMISEDGHVDYVGTIPVNPETGAPTGPAQRVTMGTGNTASFSPDGKTIAFEFHRSPGHSDLYVVPASGGTQRMLARYEDGIGESAWSADGKSIYVRVDGAPNKPASIQRVPAAGGRSDTVITYLPSDAGSSLAARGQIALYRADQRAFSEGRLAYKTLSGEHGEIRIPPGTQPTDYIGIESVHTLLIGSTKSSTAHVLDLATGKMRDVLPGSVVSREAAWSPDGDRISVQDSSAGQWAITVMNADGSHPRRYPVPSIHPVMNLWSPDGRAITYMPNATSLAVLDLTTGKSTVVSSARPGTVWGVRNIIWRPDSKSIVLVRGQANGNQEVAEVTREGAERVLRKLDGPLAGMLTGGFVSDRVMIIGTTKLPYEQFLISTDGGPPKKLPMSTRMPWFGVSPDGKEILCLLRADGPVTSLELMTSRGDSLRTIKLPFEVDRRTFFPPLLPDGKHVVLISGNSADSAKVFLVPLDGSAPSVVGTFSGTMMHGSSRLDVSPDGKSVLLTTEGAPTSTLYELDLSPLLKAGGKP